MSDVVFVYRRLVSVIQTAHRMPFAEVVVEEPEEPGEGLTTLAGDPLTTLAGDPLTEL